MTVARWKPKPNDDYWTIDEGKVVRYCWGSPLGTAADRGRWNAGLVFETAEEAMMETASIISKVRWVPAVGDTYWTCDDAGEIFAYIWSNCYMDRRKLVSGLVWQTKQEVVSYLSSNTGPNRWGLLEEMKMKKDVKENEVCPVRTALETLLSRATIQLPLTPAGEARLAAERAAQETLIDGCKNVPAVPECEKADDLPPTADSILTAAAQHMRDRAKIYDKPGGERSMAATVAAFNALTGHQLTEAQGWLLMALLKQVRLFQRPGYHADSAEDAVAYSALLAEAKVKEAGNE